MKKTWLIAPNVGQSLLKEFPDLPPVILQLLSNRGLTKKQEIEEFFNSNFQEHVHDPFLFKDMEKAVQRIFKAIEKGEKIVIFGDFDADGVTSTAVVASVLDAFGANFNYYIPHREIEGYGLNTESIQAMKNDGANLIVTVDCGISNHEEVEMVHHLGMEIIITDHHHEPLILPQAYAILNAHLKGETYPFKNLAGVGTAYKLAQAMLRYAQKKGIAMQAKHKEFYGSPENMEKWLLDLVAIGTVADCVPLIGENRTLVKYGLMVLKQSKRKGLRKLFEKMGVTDINATHIGFQIAPRINAAGRLSHASTAYGLLMAESDEESEKLIEELNNINVERQKLTEQIFAEAKSQIISQKNDKMLIAIGESWSVGVIGLVAGKLTEAYNMPSLVISNYKGLYQGSGRSNEHFNIVTAMQSVEQYLAHYGGHAQACGFTLNSNDKLLDFIQALKEMANNQLQNTDLSPVLNIDAALGFKEINWKLWEHLEKFAPFGESNPRPLFMSKNVKILQKQSVGKDNKHLRLLLRQDDSNYIWKSIAFGLGTIWGDVLQAGDYVDVAYHINLNEWNNNKELQLEVKDLKLKDDV